VANGFIDAIKTAFESIRHFPLAGVAREQLALGLRVTFHGAYAIYYRPMPDEIVIVRVLHGARDVAALVEHGGFAE
jgi:toxin ParE1/3/4